MGRLRQAQPRCQWASANVPSLGGLSPVGEGALRTPLPALSATAFLCQEPGSSHVQPSGALLTPVTPRFPEAPSTQKLSFHASPAHSEGRASLHQGRTWPPGVLPQREHTPRLCSGCFPSPCLPSPPGQIWALRHEPSGVQASAALAPSSPGRWVSIHAPTRSSGSPAWASWDEVRGLGGQHLTGWAGLQAAPTALACAGLPLGRLCLFSI